MGSHKCYILFEEGLASGINILFRIKYKNIYFMLVQTLSKEYLLSLDLNDDKFSNMLKKNKLNVVNIH